MVALAFLPPPWGSFLLPFSYPGLLLQPLKFEIGRKIWGLPAELKPSLSSATDTSKSALLCDPAARPRGHREGMGEMVLSAHGPEQGLAGVGGT